MKLYFMVILVFPLISFANHPTDETKCDTEYKVELKTEYEWFLESNSVHSSEEIVNKQSLNTSYMEMLRGMCVPVLAKIRPQLTYSQLNLACKGTPIGCVTALAKENPGLSYEQLNLACDL